VHTLCGCVQVASPCDGSQQFPAQLYPFPSRSVPFRSEPPPAPHLPSGAACIMFAATSKHLSSV
jgi:hypothetical protein